MERIVTRCPFKLLLYLLFGLLSQAVASIAQSLPLGVKTVYTPDYVHELYEGERETIRLKVGNVFKSFYGTTFITVLVKEVLLKTVLCKKNHASTVYEPPK